MLTAATNPIEGIVLLDTIAGVVLLVALLRIWTTPSWMWSRGGWSKLGWAIATLWLIPVYGHVGWPVGAILALRHIRRIQRQPLPGPGPLPFATGQTDPAWWNVEQPAPTVSENEAAADEAEPDAKRQDPNPVLALWEEGARRTESVEGAANHDGGLRPTGTDDTAPEERS